MKLQLLQGEKGFHTQLQEYLSDSGFVKGNLQLTCTRLGNNNKLLLHQALVQNIAEPESMVHRLLIVHRTGSGKTTTMITIMNQFFDDGRPIYFIVPNTNLVKNFMEELEKDTQSNFGKYFNAILKEYGLSTKKASDRDRAMSYMRSHPDLGKRGNSLVRTPKSALCIITMSTAGGTTMINPSINPKMDSFTSKPNNPRFSWLKDRTNPFHRSIVLVDEAHNLFEVLGTNPAVPKGVSAKAQDDEDGGAADANRDRLRVRALWALYFATESEVFFATATPFGRTPASHDSFRAIMLQVMGTANRDFERANEGYISYFGGLPEVIYPEVLRRKCPLRRPYKDEHHPGKLLVEDCSIDGVAMNAMALANIVYIPLQQESLDRYREEMLRKVLATQYSSQKEFQSPYKKEPSVAIVKKMLKRDPKDSLSYQANMRHLSLMNRIPATRLLARPAMRKTMDALQGYLHSTVYRHQAFGKIPSYPAERWSTKLAVVAELIQANMLLPTPKKLLVLLSSNNALASLLRIMEDWNNRRPAVDKKLRKYAVLASRPSSARQEPDVRKRDNHNTKTMRDFLEIHTDPEKRHEWSTCIADATLYSEGVSFNGVQVLYIVDIPSKYSTFMQAYGRILRACQHAHFSQAERKAEIFLFLATTRSKVPFLDDPRWNTFKTPDELFLENVLDEYRNMDIYEKLMAGMSIDDTLYKLASPHDSHREYGIPRKIREATPPPPPLHTPQETPPHHRSPRSSPPPRQGTPPSKTLVAATRKASPATVTPKATTPNNRSQMRVPSPPRKLREATPPPPPLHTPQETPPHHRSPRSSPPPRQGTPPSKTLDAATRKASPATVTPKATTPNNRSPMRVPSSPRQAPPRESPSPSKGTTPTSRSKKVTWPSPARELLRLTENGESPSPRRGAHQMYSDTSIASLKKVTSPSPARNLLRLTENGEPSFPPYRRGALPYDKMYSDSKKVSSPSPNRKFLRLTQHGEPPSPRRSRQPSPF